MDTGSLRCAVARCAVARCAVTRGAVTRSAVALVLCGLFCALPACAASGRLPVEKIRLPRGFTIEVWTADVPGARSMVLAPNGVLFVGTRADKV